MDGKHLIAIMAIVFASLFYSCSSDEVPSNGQLKMQLAGASFPSDLVEAANVIINKIEIRKTDDEEGSAFITLSNEKMEFNMRDLSNGVSTQLLDKRMAAGEYDLVRLYVSAVSIKLKDGRVLVENVPGDDETGVDLFIEPVLKIKGGVTSDLLLALDVSKSFVLEGDLSAPTGVEGFSFTPVIKAADLSITGSLKGYIMDATETPIEGVRVLVLDGQEVYTTTFTDAAGNFAILGLETGIYSLVFEKQGYKTITIDKAEVYAANTTIAELMMGIEAVD
ncbi:DUF4382 domain-containing protein [Carboxylicivirga taeanensis]|uniref:DUF4382 domain-containing protein n=1 Tax=Carboxylicivirga taeanensis TaxID=1416875 RepID=UPI003F6E4251